MIANVRNMLKNKFNLECGIFIIYYFLLKDKLKFIYYIIIYATSINILFNINK